MGLICTSAIWLCGGKGPGAGAPVVGISHDQGAGTVQQTTQRVLQLQGFCGVPFTSIYILNERSKRKNDIFQVETFPRLQRKSQILALDHKI